MANRHHKIVPRSVELDDNLLRQMYTSRFKFLTHWYRNIIHIVYTTRRKSVIKFDQIYNSMCIIQQSRNRDHGRVVHDIVIT